MKNVKMNYFEARPQIENGDHIAVIGSDFKAKIIAICQRWAEQRSNETRTKTR